MRRILGGFEDGDGDEDGGGLGGVLGCEKGREGMRDE